MWTPHHAAALFTLYAASIWAAIIIFSVLLLVPINNRVGLWNPTGLPPNWESERKLWDLYNYVRAVAIVSAFVVHPRQKN
jgi:Domain of unknown function (DUF1772).